MFRLLILACSALLFAATAHAQARNGRETPYATSFVINFSSGNGSNAYSPDPVPANKRLVIEFVTISVSAQPGDKPMAYLMDSVNSYARSYWIPLTLVDPATETYRATQLVKLNHEGNGSSGPGAGCLRAVNSFAPLSCYFAISGYLVDK